MRHAVVVHPVKGTEPIVIHLAITEDGGTPLGEVLLFPGPTPGSCEVAYAVGARHRGRRC